MSRFSHVEIELPDGRYIAVHGKTGVMIQDEDYYKDVADVSYGIIDCDEKTSKKILDYALSQVGKPYDFLAILGIVFRRDWKDSRSWMCSELLEAACSKAGYPLLRDDDKFNRVTPEDIYKSLRVINSNS